MTQSKPPEAMAFTANRSLLIATLVIVDSLHFIFARLLLPRISPGASIFYVLAFATLQVGAYGLIFRRIRFKTILNHFWFFLSIGALIGGSSMLGYEAVAFIDAGTASILDKASIPMSVALGIFWLREKFTKRQLAGAILAIIGVLIITFQPGDYVRLGSLLVLLAALMYALHTALVKRYGEEMEFVDFFFFRLFATSGLLFFFALGRGTLVWPDAITWLLIITAATVDVVISRTLFYIVLRRMTMSIHSIVLTLAPVASILWAMLLFGTIPTPQQLTGGVGVILGVMIVTLNR